MRGSGCPKCALESKYNSQRKTKEEFIKESMVTHDYFYNYSLLEYKNNKTNVKIICPTHGVFTQKPSHHLNGSTCPECSGNKVTEKKFIENSLIKHNGKYDYSLIEYENLRSKVLIICPIHGKFKQLCKYHMNGSGCPECGESKGEKKVKSFLIENNIEFNSQHKFVVTRKDLPIGYQAVQSGHAVADYILENPIDAKDWNTTSNYLIFLTAKDEASLEKLIEKADVKGINHTVFREPDIGDQITAVAFEPTELTRKLVSSLPLLGNTNNLTNKNQ